MTEGLLKYGEHGFTNILVDLTHLRALAVALICANLNWKKKHRNWWQHLKPAACFSFLPHLLKTLLHYRTYQFDAK